MAKINHSNYLDIVDTVWTSAKEKGIMHINSEEKNFDGKNFKIKGKELLNFGTCGYLALEKHPDLISNSIELTKKFGTQLSMSRAYIRPTYIQELEELMSQIFDGNKVICYTSTSNAHISVISTIIKPDDLIILDQQVHFSVQFPCKNMKLQGTEVKMIRHSNFEMLEEMIKENYNKYNRIWYMADGVYSMHGDLPDTTILKSLSEKYPKLHLYFDDAHGMGWGGKNGAGYIYDRIGVNDRIVLISTLAKGFGCVGGTAVFSDPEMYRRVDIFGGPLSYSHPLSPSNVGAAIASAKIHLSNDIIIYQNELRELMDFMNLRLIEKNLPNISSPDSPIYFIGSGLNKVTRNFVHRVLNEGIYVNTATFPVVPNDKSGLRFTITRHNTKKDIELFTDLMAYHLPKAIEEEREDIKEVYQIFNVEYKGEKITPKKIDKKIVLEEYNTISEINKEEWNNLMAERGNWSHSGMLCIEELYKNNDKVEETFDFHYFIIRDNENNPIIATHFTSGIIKDDMLALENISKQIEEVRKVNPYYLCSRTLIMGNLFAEGDFLYTNSESPLLKNAMELLVKRIEEVKKEVNAKVIMFRDFNEDKVINPILENHGYVKNQLPNTNIISNKLWNNYDELLNQIQSKKNRYHIRKHAINLESNFEVEYFDSIDLEKSKLYHKLFLNIKNNSYAYNFFAFPDKITSIISKYPEWEFIELRLKASNEIVGCVWSFKEENHYSPMVVGINTDNNEKHHTYKQLVFQIIKRANMLNKKRVFCGLSADFEKQKYKANTISKFAYSKFDDTFNLEIIESLSI